MYNGDIALGIRIFGPMELTNSDKTYALVACFLLQEDWLAASLSVVSDTFLGLLGDMFIRLAFITFPSIACG